MCRMGEQSSHIQRGQTAPIVKYMEYGLSDVSCAKTGEPIDMSFGRLSWVGPGTTY